MKLIHLLSVLANQRPDDRASVERLYPESDRERWAAEIFMKPGVYFTVLDDNYRPMACFGVIDVAPGIGKAWGVLADGISRCARSGIRAFKVLLNSDCYRRIEADVETGNDRAIKFIEKMGFAFNCSREQLAINGDAMLLYSFTKRN